MRGCYPEDFCLKLQPKVAGVMWPHRYVCHQKKKFQTMFTEAPEYKDHQPAGHLVAFPQKQKDKQPQRKRKHERLPYKGC